MIDINLLPPEYAPKKLVSPINLAVICLFFLIGLSLILSSLKLMAAVQDYSGRCEYHNQQIRYYKPQVEDIRELRKRVKLLKTRLSLVEQLLKEKATWSDKLVELYECLPQSGIWLDSLSIDRQKATLRLSSAGAENVEAEMIMVNISGNVISVDKVRQFVANLEESDTFYNVVLDSAASTSMGLSGGSLMQFRITVQILVPGE